MNPRIRRLTTGLVVAAVAAGLGGAATGSADAADSLPVRLIVGLKPGFEATTRLSSLSRLGLSGAEAQGQARHGLLAELGAKSLKVPASRVQTTLAALRQDPSVSYAAVDLQRKATAVSVDDPLYTAGYQPELSQIKVPTAWETTTGSTVKVAVVDTGVSAVGDLAGKVLQGYDFFNGDNDPTDDAEFPHGTVVSSLIAGTGDNGAGIAGVCWQCQILPVKVLDDEGSGYDSDIADGIVYAVKNGAQIVNLSLGGAGSSTLLKNAVAYANARGALVVASAGNEGTTEKMYPAAYTDVLSVAATTTATTGRASWSTYGDWVDVAAPGITAGMWNTGEYCYNDITTAPANCVGTYQGVQYYKVQGTSFSAPLVSGVAALIKSAHPSYSGWSIQNAIKTTATDNSWTDKGLVNAASAITYGADTTAPTYKSWTPANNAKVHGTVAVTPSGLADNWSGIRAVDLYVNDKWNSWDYTSPFAPTFNTSGKNGSYKIKLKITDKAGNITWTGTRTIVADNITPTVSITKAPKNKAKVKGTVKVYVKASDKSGISKVQLIVNGKVVATDATSGYKLTFKVAKQKKTMKVRVRAYDKAGNVKYTTTRTYYRA
ncbi:S8 family serine peptidase [Actinoplanes sp. NPDC051851]|uniref:S8 family serine peptidase n=1 Tax=Actinoplanes sp. NPDC051851 TaxID=3154753 RepID=UPI003414C450